MPFISEVETIFLQRFYTGWITLRNQLTTPIRVMGRRIIELYDALITGNDWEVTPLLSLKRRAGHTAYATITAPALYLYSWKTNTQGTIPVFSETSAVEYVGNSGLVSLTTKTATTGLNLQDSILGIGDYLYVGNAQSNFKFDGPSGSQGKTKWGLAAAGASANIIGPTIAGAGANVNLVGGTAWTNPNNVTSASSFATVSLAAFAFSQDLQAKTYGFSVPSGEVLTGVAVTFDALISVSSSMRFTAQLMINGAVVGTVKGLTSPTTSVATYTVGSINDLWGLTTLTPSQANDATWSVAFVNQNTGGPTFTTSIRNVNMTLYGIGGPTATPTGSGSFTAVNGYSYVIAYGNSASGEISNASPVSANTGPFTSKASVDIAVTASADTQVNQIRVYRTTDSGGGNQFFEISNSPFANTSTTIHDTTPDTSLQVTSQAEINLGNTPPPAGLINLEWFSGRMWGSVNNNLFASTGAETLSGTAPNSNWNPLFQWVIPGVLVRVVAWSSGLIIFTQDDSYIVRGTDITNYTVNEFVKDFGVRTVNAVDTDGTNLYVFTSDRQFILLSASGAQDIGLPIADQLFNVDPNFAYVKVNRYGLDSIVRILDTVNNVFYDYNLNQQCWNLPGILQMPLCTAMGSIETAPGVWRLLLSSNNSGTVQLAYRDITNFQDLGTSYAPVAVFGSIQLADPGNLAKFGGRGGFCMEYTNAGIAPTLTILFNEMGATLTNAVGSQVTGNFIGFGASAPINGIPTLTDGTTTYRTLYYYLMALAQKRSGYVRHMQFKLAAPAENTATELIGWGIYGDLKGEATAPGQAPQLQGK